MYDGLTPSHNRTGRAKAETMHTLKKPCSGCPYTKGCPSGVWDKSEYQKLAEYDNETGDQPLGVFLCHDGDRENALCRGWLDTHDKPELLSLRMAISMGSLDSKIMGLPLSSVPCFESGTAAMEHGLAQISDISEEALELQGKLVARHPDLELK